jgi:hypothetical protein
MRRWMRGAPIRVRGRSTELEPQTRTDGWMGGRCVLLPPSSLFAIRSSFFVPRARGGGGRDGRARAPPSFFCLSGLGLGQVYVEDRRTAPSALGCAAPSLLCFPLRVDECVLEPLEKVGSPAVFLGRQVPQRIYLAQARASIMGAFFSTSSLKTLLKRAC